MNPMDMSEEEFIVYQARRDAAAVVRKKGDETLAARIERGDADDHWRVRWGIFWHSPRFEPDPEFMAAWDEFARRDAERRRG